MPLRAMRAEARPRHAAHRPSANAARQSSTRSRTMRIAEATLMSLAVAVAVPSAAGAQVLTPFLGNPWPLYDERLDHPVPVATVSRVDDLVSLSHPRTVQDGLGEPFVL